LPKSGIFGNNAFHYSAEMKPQSVALYASWLLVPFSGVQASESGERLAVRVKISLTECSRKTGACKESRPLDDEEIHIALEQDASNIRSGYWERNVLWRGKMRTLFLSISHSQDKLWTLEKGIKWRQGEQTIFDVSSDQFRDISSVDSIKFERTAVTPQKSHFLTFEGRL
jgi:hypothetical protein